MRDEGVLATRCVGTAAEGRPTMVFLHGFMGSGRDWAGVMAAMAADVRCIAVDLPGHGRSLGFGDEAMTLPGMSRLLAATLRGLDVETYTLVGYSMGGRVALHHALCSDNEIERLVIESAHCGLADEGVRRARQVWDGTIATRLLTEPLTQFLDDWYGMGLFASLRGCAGFDALVARRRVNDAAELARSMRLAGTGSMRPLWAEWAAYRRPVQLIVGALDEKYVGLADAMRAANNRATRTILPGVGHNTHFEDTEAFVDALRAV